MIERRQLGIAVIGSGRIGTLRARLAATHPAVTLLAVSDVDGARAHELAQQTGAQFSSADNVEVIARPEVTAVIVATSEGEHSAPVLAAWLDHLAVGKPCVLATAREARDNLEVTLAIECSAASGNTVKLPLAQ